MSFVLFEGNEIPGLNSLVWPDHFLDSAMMISHARVAREWPSLELCYCLFFFQIKLPEVSTGALQFLLYADPMIDVEYPIPNLSLFNRCCQLNQGVAASDLKMLGNSRATSGEHLWKNWVQMVRSSVFIGWSLTISPLDSRCIDWTPTQKLPNGF